MEHGLDIGPAAIRVATDAAAIESEPPIVLPADESTFGAAGVSADDVRTVDRAGTTYVVGGDARTIAEATGAEPTSLFETGLLTADEYAGPALSAIVSELLGEPIDGALYYTIPGRVVDATVLDESHCDRVESVLGEWASERTPVSKGVAVVYDQLAEENYTGLGLCLESQTTSVALLYYGVPVLSFSIASGSEWLIAQAADQTGRSHEAVADTFESFVLDPNAAAGEIERALADAHDTLVGDLVTTIADEADASDVQEGLAVPIAIGGDGTVEGLEYLVGGRFDAASVPFSISGVQRAEEPAASAVRGALEAAKNDLDAFDEITWGTETSDTVTQTADGTAPEPAGESDGTALSFDELPGAEPDRDRTNDAIDQLFDRLANRDEEVETISEEVDTLASDLESVDERSASVEMVESRLETLGDEAATERDLDALADTVDTLDDELAALETVDRAVATLDDEFEGVDERLGALAERTDEVAERLEAVAAETDDRIDALSAETDDRIETVESALTGDLDELSNDLAGLETDLDGLASDQDSLAETFSAETAAAADDRGSLDDRLTTLRRELSGVTDRTDILTARVKTVRSEVSALDRQAASKRDLATVERTVSTLDSKLATLDDAISDVSDRTEELAELETTMAAETDLDALDGDLEAIEKRQTDRETAVDDRLGRLETRFDDVDETIDDRVGGLQSALDTAESRLDDLGDRLDTTVDVSTVEDVRTDLETVSDDIDELTETIEPALDDVETLRTDHDRLAETVTDGRNDRLDDQQDRLETLQAEVDALQSESNGSGSIVAPTLAGGGGAALVAGAVIAVTETQALGAGVDGAIVGGVAIALGVVLVTVATRIGN